MHNKKRNAKEFSKTVLLGAEVHLDLTIEKTLKGELSTLASDIAIRNIKAYAIAYSRSLQLCKALESDIKDLSLNEAQKHVSWVFEPVNNIFIEYGGSEVIVLDEQFNISKK